MFRYEKDSCKQKRNHTKTGSPKLEFYSRRFKLGSKNCRHIVVPEEIQLRGLKYSSYAQECKLSPGISDNCMGCSAMPNGDKKIRVLSLDPIEKRSAAPSPLLLLRKL